MIPRTLAMMLTNKCNFYCDHCSVCAGPDVNDTLSDELIRKAIDHTYYIPSIRVVSFTGGEVTLYPEKLKMAIAYAHEKGFITRIVTNAWWANSLENARKWCAEFVKCGLDEINISYDDFHAEYLQLFGGEQNIKYAVQALQETNMSLLIGIVLAPGHKIKSKYIQANIGDSIQCFEGQIAPFGRARELLPEKNFFKDQNIRACDDAGSSLVVLPTGKVAFCCGHALFSEAQELFIIDNLNSDKTLIDMLDLMHRNVLIWYFYLNGPTKLLEELGAVEDIRNSCEACFYLSTKYRFKLLELAKNKKEIFKKLEEGRLNNKNFGGL